MTMISPDLMHVLQDERLAAVEYKRLLREQPDRRVPPAWAYRLAAFLRRMAERLDAAPAPRGQTRPARVG